MWHPSHVPFRDHIGAILHIQGTHIVVTPKIVSKELHVLRVAHPDYLGYERLRIVSKDEMIFAFCERPAD